MWHSLDSLKKIFIIVLQINNFISFEIWKTFCSYLNLTLIVITRNVIVHKNLMGDIWRNFGASCCGFIFALWVTTILVANNFKKYSVLKLNGLSRRYRHILQRLARWFFIVFTKYLCLSDQFQTWGIWDCCPGLQG